MHPSLAGVIVGFVTSTGGEPLPYADVTVQSRNIRALADAGGRFEWVNAPAGTFMLRVRRIGYAPASVSVTVVDGRTDTVRVALTPISIRLDAVKTSDDQCGGQLGGDTAVVSILQQVQLNAERYRLLTRDYPFVTRMERITADDLVEPSFFTGRIRTLRRNERIDTIALAAERARPYRPGELIAKSTSFVPNDIHGRLLIPTLPDFADSSFIATHCFRYAGLTTEPAGRMIRVDFKPVRSLREPDVSGSLYLDASTYQIAQSNLLMSVPALTGGRDIWDITVDTRFHEILSGIAIISGVCERTMLASETKTARVDGRTVRLGSSAVEFQRVLDIEFVRASPDLGERRRLVTGHIPCA